MKFNTLGRFAVAAALTVAGSAASAGPLLLTAATAAAALNVDHVKMAIVLVNVVQRQLAQPETQRDASVSISRLPGVLQQAQSSVLSESVSTPEFIEAQRALKATLDRMNQASTRTPMVTASAAP